MLENICSVANSGGSWGLELVYITIERIVMYDLTCGRFVSSEGGEGAKEDDEEGTIRVTCCRKYLQFALETFHDAHNLHPNSPNPSCAI
jgi:hypothetical protein